MGGWGGCRSREGPFHIALTPHQIEVNTSDPQADERVGSGSAPHHRLEVTMVTAPSRPPHSGLQQRTVYQGWNNLKHTRTHFVC